MAKSQEPVLFYGSNYDNDAARVAIVSVYIESALLHCGAEIYNQVVKSLEKNYDCDVADCYMHPEYLNEIFKTLPRDSRYQIVESIRKGLEEFSYLRSISKFLYALNP